MKAKYDIARLHKDFLAWCENPQLKPWMVAETIHIKRTKDSFIVKNDDGKLFTLYFDLDWSLEHPSFLFQKASVIGLDIESYRLTEDRDQAVRDYLAGIEEGAPLWEGSEWVKEADSEAVFARLGLYARLNLVLSNGFVCTYAYTFLRLDLREETK